MSSDPRLPELFEHAAGLADEERGRFLADIALDSPELAREISELLGAAPRGERLEVPALDRLAVLAAGSPPPDRVATFRIVREIGRGGMGRVFLAEQEVEGYRRAVALKLLDRAGARPLGEDDVRRFRDELRILASLEHPGIARFLDGGRSPEGIWFLALEYVDGVDLVSWAERHGLDLEARLRLFRGVLEAVSYAHARGVVHRDLKPANVLVGSDGRPRLLDFGLSKLVAAEGGDSTLTRTETRALTPAYASPEQYRGERATAASDVFSLGVMLYELLAGRRPFESGTSSAAALERAVLESEAVPPSAVAESNGDAAARRLSPRRRRPRRDLDVVCLKALRKAPRDRYPDAAAFASDLDRHLAGEPVEARRGEAFYRLRVALSRHRVVAALAAVVVFAAIGFAFHEYRQRAAEAPETAAARFAELREIEALAVDELERRFAATPSDQRVGWALVRALVAGDRTREAAVVVGRMRQVPDSDREPLVDQADAHVATGLDQPQRALALLTRALARAEELGRGELVARLRAGKGRHLTDLGQVDVGRLELERALGEAERLGDDETRLRALNDLAILDLQAGELESGERRLGVALDAARRLGDDRRTTALLHNLGGLATLRGRFGFAAERFAEAAAVAARIPSPRRRASTVGDGALARWHAGRPEGAVAALDEAIAILRGLDDHGSRAYYLAYRAEIELAAGALADLEAAAAEVEAEGRASGALDGLALAERLRGLGAAADGDHDAARALFQRSERIFRENGNHDLATSVTVDLALFEVTAGATESASRLAREAISRAGGSGTEVAMVAGLLLARLDALAGDAAGAERRLRELGPELELQDGLRGRFELARARAAVAAARGDLPGADRELGEASVLAERSARTVEGRALAAEREQLLAAARDLARSAAERP